MPLMAVLNCTLIVWAAIRKANIVTTATPPKPRTTLFAIGPSLLNPQNTPKAATNTLIRAPTSAPSITTIPTASPARMNLSHPQRGGVLTMAAAARKLQPAASICWPTPQQAVEKKPEFSAAAKPPMKHASRLNFSCQKNTQALHPKNSSTSGAKNFAKPTGPSSQNQAWLRFGMDVPPLLPIELRSYQTPV